MALTPSERTRRYQLRKAGKPVPTVTDGDAMRAIMVEENVSRATAYRILAARKRPTHVETYTVPRRLVRVRHMLAALGAERHNLVQLFDQLHSYTLLRNDEHLRAVARYVGATDPDKLRKMLDDLLYLRWVTAGKPSTFVNRKAFFAALDQVIELAQAPTVRVKTSTYRRPTRDPVKDGRRAAAWAKAESEVMAQRAQR